MNLYYEGKLLVAPPMMRDWRFYKSVVYLWNHDSTGATGIIINKPLEFPKFRDICSEAEVIVGEGINPTVFYGGPIMENTVGCLHTKDYCLNSSNGLYGPLNFTFDRQIINDIALGKGPEQYIITMGVASWQAGQLEQEIEALPPRSKSESWLVLDYDPNLIWLGDQNELWNACVNMSVAQQSKEYVSKFLSD